MTDDTPRLEPSAAGGKFEVADAAVGPGEKAWTRAALLSVQARSADALAWFSAIQARTVEALLAVDADERHTMQEALLALRVMLEESNGLRTRIDELTGLVDALAEADPTFCTRCGAPVGIFPDREVDGWQHWREGGADQIPELYTPDDGHEPAVGREPRNRPDIAGGRVVPQPSDEG